MLAFAAAGIEPFQLLAEAWIGTDRVAAAQQVRHRVAQREVEMSHQIDCAGRTRPRDAGVAVNVDRAAGAADASASTSRHTKLRRSVFFQQSKISKDEAS